MTLLVAESSPRDKDKMIGFVLTLLNDGASVLEKREDDTAKKIIRIVAQRSDIAVKSLVGKSRERSFVNPRFIAVYLIKKYTDLSLNQIAKHFGGKNHATIINGCREVEKKLASQDKKFISMFVEIEAALIKNFSTT